MIAGSPNTRFERRVWLAVQLILRVALSRLPVFFSPNTPSRLQPVHELTASSAEIISQREACFPTSICIAVPSRPRLQMLIGISTLIPHPLTSFLIPQPHPSSEWYKLILIGIYTGLRLGDCCRLDWSQINLPEGVIQLVPEKTQRHHKRIVTIPVHPALGEALLAVPGAVVPGAVVRDDEPSTKHQALSTTLSGPVLPMVAGMYGRARWQVSDQLSRIFKAAHIQTSVMIEGRKRRTPEASFHSLRHTFVSFAANAGVPLHIVQSIVGHESTAMTRHYYHENIAALKSAVAAIPTL